MPQNDPLYGSKANTEPLEFDGSRQTLERYEDLVRCRLVKTRTIVPDETDGASRVVPHSEFDDRLLQFAGVFPGIADKGSVTPPAADAGLR